MQTLTVNNEINIKNTYENHLFGYDVRSSFYWGKCCIDDKTKEVQFMQIAGNCKDYVVDTYYRTYTHGFQRDIWKDEKIEYPSVYIWSGESFTKQYIQRIKEVLNPWEEANGFIPTEAFKVDFGDTKLATPVAAEGVIVIKFDPVWMINSMAMSFFLSIVRHAVQTGVIQFKDSDKKEYLTREQEYYYRLSKDLKSVIDYSIDNPREYLDQIKDATPTGYPTNPNSHGCTGLFYILNQFWHKYNNDVEYRKTFNKTSISRLIYNHPNAKYIEYVVNKLEEQKLENVKMQSLQPKVKRPRTRKAATTITPSEAW